MVPRRCDLPDPEKMSLVFSAWILGVVNIAFDSDGRPYTGAEIEKLRSRYALRRAVTARH
jgi:hypothetical protein